MSIGATLRSISRASGSRRCYARCGRSASADRRTVRLALAIAVLATVAFAVTFCAHPPAGARPNVVLVTIDTERADHTSTYGYPHPTTPHLDALAADGAVFTAAYTAIPTTGPSHAGLFTAQYPAEHGVLRNGDVLGATPPTLTELLARAGYVTAAFVSAYPLAQKFGYARGFATYDDEFTAADASIVLPEWEGERVESAGFDRRADATTERALRWLAGAPRDHPVFLWVHYYDPHEPYDPPPAYRDGIDDARSPLERAVAAYDAEIRFADDQLGRLIDAVDRRLGAGDTLVVIATDHGEGLMQHGWMGHGANLYEELVRTVLVFRRPGHLRAQRSATPVGLIDVAPTVLAHVGLDAGALHPRGVDLAGAPPADRPLFFQRRVYQPGSRDDVPVRGAMHGVRIGSWKYVDASSTGPELFDLASDPGETRNLRERETARADELAAVLGKWRVAQGGAVEAPLSPDEARRLRALGYVE